MGREIWRIEKLVPGGAGMARRADGSVGFASGALPGEQIEVSQLTRKKGYAKALEFQLLEPSGERVQPACPLARACGGCDWLHLDYEAQCRHKASLLAEALGRTGGFRVLPPIAITPSPRQSGYRSRIRLHIDEQGRFGFFAAESHRLIEITSCAAAAPELDAALARFSDSARRFPELLGAFEQAELRVAPPPSPSGSGLRLTPRGPAEAASARAEPLLAELRASFSVAIAGVEAELVQRWPLSDTLSLDVPLEAFVQVNWDVNRLLVASLVEGARRRSVRHFLDLYAGAGNFTLALAAEGLTGVSVEGHPSAARAARRSVERYAFARVQVQAEDVKTALLALEASPSDFDLAVLDPPRAGAAEILPSLIKLAPRAIAYVSCDPVTLSRDLRTLCQQGYALDGVQAFDMFPGTHHVEALAWVSRA
jgi:23S rRNA (uracil1939-C5)-methyltransferase